ncbi:hypothetical protein LC048_24445 [Mesobacillus subterraneus]|uniref:hypothetical protein n=1 Tax=Mesobacillus subterraneus TaxID=285983 RepID=UPI0027401203|nr:hypothetical protein [Mesobacillus subterraneus]WLR55374.1 hypothetical protein LC048_24445 [Mesobacillus subterraneus]
MEEQLKKLKQEMLEGELEGFEFGPEMQKKVVARFNEKPRVSRFRFLIPTAMSAAFLLIFSFGIYYVIKSDPLMNQGETTPDKEEAPVDEPPVDDMQDEEKPELIVPPYVPEGYVFKHTHTNDDVYEHLYVNEQNEVDYFAYVMRKEKPGYPVPGSPVKLAADLDGVINKVTEDHIFLTWQDEGMYQIVERKGSMEESEFYRIAEAILKAKGFEANLDSLPKVEETEPEVSFGEKEALSLLQRYNSVRKTAFQDALDELDFKFRTYKTKEEFYQLFVDFMSYEYVEATFSFRLDERDDGLYVIPMDSVRTFWSENPFNLGKISDHEYQLTQVQEGDMNGRETLIVTFKNQDGIWKIESIQTEKDLTSPWLNHGGAVTILRDYSEIQERVFADASEDSENKFQSYQTIEEINNEFNGLATEKFLQTHLDGIVEERSDGIYLISNEKPARFMDGLKSNLKRLSDTEYKLTQLQENNWMITCTFKRVNETWLLNSFTVQQQN